MSAVMSDKRKPDSRSWPWTEEQDQVIRDVWPRIYRRETNVATLAKRLGGVSDCQLRARAKRLGVAVLRDVEREWTDDEIEYMCQIAHLGLNGIQKRMRKRGWPRSLNAIGVKLARLNQKTRGENVHLYSADGLAQLLGVAPDAVRRWISCGWLKAKPHSSTATASNRWDIVPSDVVRFMRDHTARVDFSRADKFWLVDLLTSGGQRYE